MFDALIQLLATISILFVYIFVFLGWFPEKYARVSSVRKTGSREDQRRRRRKRCEEEAQEEGPLSSNKHHARLTRRLSRFDTSLQFLNFPRDNSIHRISGKANLQLFLGIICVKILILKISYPFQNNPVTALSLLPSSTGKYIRLCLTRGVSLLLHGCGETLSETVNS